MISAVALSALTDNDLLVRFRDCRCTDSFNSIYERHATQLVSKIARKFFLESSDAEDVAQQTWSTVIESCGTFDPQFKFVNWLRGIADNHARRHLRKSRRVEALSEAEPLDYREPEASRRIEAQEQVLKVQIAVARMPTQSRIGVALVCRGVSARNAAVLAGIGLRTLYRRIESLREVLIGSDSHR